MLTKEAMLKGWTLLHDRFGNKASDAILLIYFKELKTKLDDKQWAIAVERTILEETFFPSAKTLWEKVIVSPDESAAIHWATILDSAQRGVKPALDPNAECALLRIGGRMAIEQATTEKLVWLKKEFTDTYKTICSSQAKKFLGGDDSNPSLPQGG